MMRNSFLQVSQDFLEAVLRSFSMSPVVFVSSVMVMGLNSIKYGDFSK